MALNIIHLIECKNDCQDDFRIETLDNVGDTHMSSGKSPTKSSERRNVGPLDRQHGEGSIGIAVALGPERRE